MPFHTAIDLAAAIRRREVSPVEVLDEYLSEVDRLNPVLNAVVFRDDDRARAEAQAAADLVTSRDAADLPPFCGVPVPIKDLDDVEGWPTSYGSLGTADGPVDQDSLEVERLEDAGFVLMGKTATPEFGAISCTESQRFGATRNPWNTDHTPGGSSGGAGAAVAAGMAPVAHASDGGGSIRIPASCNGLVGLKPSRNRVLGRVESLHGASTNGVLTRTVADTAAVLDVLGAPDPGSWNFAPPEDTPFRDAVREDPGRLRIRLCAENALGLEPDPAVVDAMDAAGAQLEALGHHVELAPPHWPDAAAFLTSFLIVWSTISAGTPIVDETKLEPHVRADRVSARTYDAITYVESLQQLQLASRQFTEQFGRDFDVLVSPTMAVLPPRVGAIWLGAEEEPSAPIANATPMACYTAVFNVTGQPAISLPLHVDDSGLPVGVQFAAGPWQDRLLLQLGAQLEAAAPWADRHPSL
ncbi:MAG: amidase [Actinobacteria bacterium]|nr:amidase [Actinomycetota bacterium]